MLIRSPARYGRARVRARLIVFCRGFVPAVMLGAATAHAQGVPAADPPAAEQVGEIIVSAQRRNETIQSVPVAVTALSAASLEQANIVSTQDLPILTPSLEFSEVGSMVSRVSGASAPQQTLHG